MRSPGNFSKVSEMDFGGKFSYEYGTIWMTFLVIHFIIIIIYYYYSHPCCSILFHTFPFHIGCPCSFTHMRTYQDHQGGLLQTGAVRMDGLCLGVLPRRCDTAVHKIDTAGSDRDRFRPKNGQLDHTGAGN